MSSTPPNLPPGTVLFLSGPMTSLPHWNHPAFTQAAKLLREQGYIVLNPAEIANGNTTLPREYYLRECLRLVADAQAIVVLPGWRKSKGARQEVFNGRELGIPILDLSLNPVEETICQEADRLVSDDRQNTYGPPSKDFARTATMWTGAFADLLKPDAKFEARHVPVAMVCVKLSRLMNGPHRDGCTDLAGYAKCLDMVDTAK